MGAPPSPHLWLFPHPLEYPRKNKTAELHSSHLLSPEEATSALRMGGWGWREERRGAKRSVRGEQRLPEPAGARPRPSWRGPRG